MSASAIKDGIVATLTACGPFAASQISTCAFDVLEASQTCAITFFPGNSEFNPDRFDTVPSRNYYRRWRINGTLWIRDTGDPINTLSRVWQAQDDLFNTFSKDDSLQSSACAARLVSISHNIDTFRQVGGQLWKPVDWVIEADEF